MDFTWTEEELEYKQAAIRFAQKELSTGVIKNERTERFPRDLWQKCADFGVLGLPFPEAYGGAAADILTTMLVMEGLGYGGKDNGLLFALNAQMWTVQHPISAFGTAEQQARWLPGLIRGEIIGAHGMSEPDSGSDAYSLRTRAEKRDGGYLLNGTKTFVTNAPVCDLAVVFATTAPEKGSWGLSAFVVERGTSGFSVGKTWRRWACAPRPWAN